MESIDRASELSAGTSSERTRARSLIRWLTVTPAVAAFIFLPWSRDLSHLANAFDAGLLFMLAIFAPQLIAGLVLSRSPAEGGAEQVLREGIRQLSCQIVLAFAFLVPVLAAGSLNLSVIAQWQSGGYQHWLIFHDPFNGVAFLLSVSAIHGALAARLAADRRFATVDAPPFRAALFLLAALQASVWLGAWYDPFNLVIHLENLSHDGAGITRWGIAIAANGLGVLVFFAKAWALFGLQQFLARNLPRYRFAEVLRLGFRMLLPAACLNLLAAAAYLWLIQPLPAFQRAMQIGLAVVISLTAPAIAISVLYGRFSKTRLSTGMLLTVARPAPPLKEAEKRRPFFL